jgi:hypothetical protein
MAKQDKLKCPFCKIDFGVMPKDYQPNGAVRCPGCQKLFTPPKSAQAAAAEAPARKAEVFLPVCLVCEAGPIRIKGVEGDETVYVCDTCQSLLKESLFGFQYSTIDSRFEKLKAELANQTFTKVEILDMARKTEKSEKKPVVDEKAPVEEELFWELDEEELALRKKAPQTARKEVTVDDLLHELKSKDQPAGAKERK